MNEEWTAPPRCNTHMPRCSNGVAQHTKRSDAAMEYHSTIRATKTPQKNYIKMEQSMDHQVNHNEWSAPPRPAATHTRRDAAMEYHSTLNVAMQQWSTTAHKAPPRHHKDTTVT